MSGHPASDEVVLTLGGYAGTGKTTLISFFREMLGDKVDVAFMSFTGKATAVMKKKLFDADIVGELDSISTIHSYMYTPELDAKGNIIGWRFKSMSKKGDWPASDEAPYADLFIIDEASMLPAELYNDLLNYGVPILGVGDHGQLPPINSSFNLVQDPDVRLEEIHRQAENNPIIHFATMARTKRDIPYETSYPSVKRLQRLDTKVQGLVENPNKDTLVICATNKRRVRINEYVRGRRGWEGRPQPGERVICLRNYHNEGLYNGLLCTIKTVVEPVHNSDINWQIKLEDDEGRVHDLEVAKYHFLNSHGTRPDNLTNRWRDLGKLFDYAYALTCHKAQGSEAKRVVVIGQGFGEDKHRWLYTAITRAKEELYLVD